MIALRLVYATALVSLSSFLTELARAVTSYSQKVVNALEAEL
jgi:hypothetical protein